MLLANDFFSKFDTINMTTLQVTYRPSSAVAIA